MFWKKKKDALLDEKVAELKINAMNEMATTEEEEEEDDEE